LAGTCRHRCQRSSEASRIGVSLRARPICVGWAGRRLTTKDLDQIEVAQRVPTGIRLHVAIGDVAAAVEKGSPIDERAQSQTQTICTAVKNFPMLPLEADVSANKREACCDRSGRNLRLYSILFRQLRLSRERHSGGVWLRNVTSP
jgi:RNB domain